MKWRLVYVSLVVSYSLSLSLRRKSDGCKPLRATSASISIPIVEKTAVKGCKSPASARRKRRSKSRAPLFSLFFFFSCCAKGLHCRVLHKDADTGHVCPSQALPKGYPCLSGPKSVASGLSKQILGDVDRPKGCWRSLILAGRVVPVALGGGCGALFFQGWIDKRQAERVGRVVRVAYQGSGGKGRAQFT